MEEVQILDENHDSLEVVSYSQDSVDGITKVIQLDSEDRDVSPVNWDTCIRSSSSNCVVAMVQVVFHLYEKEWLRKGAVR